MIIVSIKNRFTEFHLSSLHLFVLRKDDNASHALRVATIMIGRTRRLPCRLA
jgi:hypothetical protein